MAATVITIARTMGAGGEDIGRKVAESLGFRYVDSEIITKAAEAAGLAPEAVQKAEGRQSFLTRVLERMAAGAITAEAGLYVSPDAFGGGIEQTIIDVVQATAEEGNCVIVAHGAGIALAGSPNTLRVLVTAPVDVRVARVGSSKAVADSDRARREFFERFFRVYDEEPTRYDLIVNTQSVPDESAVAAIVALAR